VYARKGKKKSRDAKKISLTRGGSQEDGVPRSRRPCKGVEHRNGSDWGKKKIRSAMLGVSSSTVKKPLSSLKKANLSRPGRRGEGGSYRRGKEELVRRERGRNVLVASIKGGKFVAHKSGRFERKSETTNTEGEENKKMKRSLQGKGCLRPQTRTAPRREGEKRSLAQHCTSMTAQDKRKTFAGQEKGRSSC